MAVTIYNVIVRYSLCSHTTGDISSTFLKEENKDDYVAKPKGGNFHGFFFSLIDDYHEYSEN